MSNGEELDIANVTVGTGNEAERKKKEQENFNVLVEEFAAFLGIDLETENIDFRTIIRSPVDEDTGVNEYGLTQSNIDELLEYEDEVNIDAARNALKVLSARSSNANPLSASQTESIANAIGMDVGTFESIMGNVLGGNLDRAYESQQGRMVIDYDTGGKKVPDPENPGAYKMVPFTSHFTKPIHFFINDESSEDDITEFQQYLIRNNVVSPDYFVGTEGEHSLALEGAITEIMQWFDANYSFRENAPGWNKIMEQDQIFFTEGQYYEWDQKYNSGTNFEESPWAKEFQENLKLFDEAVQLYGTQNKELYTLEKARQEEAIIDQLKQSYSVPSPLQREQEVEEWFINKLGRRASENEITEWANGIAESYSSTFKNIASNLLAMQEANKAEQWAQDYLSTNQAPIKSFDEMTDLSAELAVEDPMLREREERESEYGTEIKAHDMGALKKKQQTAVLRMMLGK